MSHRGMVGLAGYDGLGAGAVNVSPQTTTVCVPAGLTLGVAVIGIPLSAGICAGLGALVGLAFDKPGKFAKYGAIGGLALGGLSLAFNLISPPCATTSY